jgi:uncharacterized cupredoxin-like copper-binding protein
MTRPSIRSIAAPAAIAFAALTLAAPAGAQAGRQATAATTTTVQVRAGEFFFKLSSKSITKPGTVTFMVHNAGHVSHDFRINSKTSAMVSPGKTVKLVVVFRKKGAFRYICSVPGHAAAGMNGIFTVR